MDGSMLCLPARLLRLLCCRPEVRPVLLVRQADFEGGRENKRRFRRIPAIAGDRM